jgi:hypothetical protein
MEIFAGAQNSGFRYSLDLRTMPIGSGCLPSGSIPNPKAAYDA